MDVPARALWPLQLASRPWLWLMAMAAGAALACCWPHAPATCAAVLLIACALGATFQATEQLQTLAGEYSRAGRWMSARCRRRGRRRSRPGWRMLFVATIFVVITSGPEEKVRLPTPPASCTAKAVSCASPALQQCGSPCAQQQRLSAAPCLRPRCGRPAGCRRGRQFACGAW